MALTPVEKIKLLKYLNTTSSDNLYHDNFYKGVKITKTTYYETLVFLTDFLNNKLITEKPSLNLINKFLLTINSLIDWCFEEGLYVDGETIGKLEKIDENLEAFLIKNGKEFDKETKSSFEDFKSNRDVRYSLGKFAKKEVLEESQDAVHLDKENEEIIKKFQDEIKELKDKILLQEQIIANVERESLKKDKAIKKREERISNLDSSLGEIRAEKKELNEMLADYKKNISGLEKRVKELEQNVILITESRADAVKRHERLSLAYDALLEEKCGLEVLVEELRGTIKNFEEKEKLENQRKELENIKNEELRLRNLKIESLIISELAKNPLTIEKIVQLLKKEDINLGTKEAYEYLRQLKTRVNITSPSLNSFPPEYVICRPNILVDGKLSINLDNNAQCFDILFVSDFHVSKVDDEIKNAADGMYEYCARNNINLVLDLGDFLDSPIYGQTMVSSGLSESQSLMEDVINNFPNHEGIYHAILGGNHDKKMNDYGIDPISFLTNAREDFISLGYDHCAIDFKRDMVSTGGFIVHHPQRRIPDPFIENDNSYNALMFVKYLEDYYSKSKYDKYDSYIDVIGHFHKSLLDTINEFAVVPSITRDRQTNGAWHLKVYFDNNKNIKYMIFIPLIKLEKTMIPVTEIVYQKKLCR